MKFNIRDYIGNYVMHVKNIDEYDSFSEYLDSEGRVWNTGERFVKVKNYNWYREDTCIAFNRGQLGSVEWYERSGYSVLEYSDFDRGETNDEPEEFFEDIECLFGEVDKNV